MRTLIIVLLTSALVPIHSGSAQGPLILPPPTHIRFALPPYNQLEEGEVVVQRGDSLWVRSSRMGDTTAFALSALSRLDVRTGSDRHVLRDSGIGFLGGAIVGAVMGTTAKDETEPNCTGLMGVCDRAGTKAAWEIGGLAFLGTVGGAIVGLMDVTERWQPVIKNTVSLAAPRRGGTHPRTYDVGVSIRIF